MTTTTRAFMEEIAEMIRAKGREVAITETSTTLRLSAPAPFYYEDAISMSASRIGRTNKWRIDAMRVGQFDVRTRSDMVISVRVHA
jgi:hypothetical protein